MIPPGGVTLLRPVLELAWAVARAGEQRHPKEPAPRSLRPFLQFARLPDRALDAAYRAVDEDDEFRARLAPGALEEHVGRAGFLFVHRPDGWAEELAALQAEAVDAESAVEEEQQERTARRRLRAVEDAHRKATAALHAAEIELADAAAALATEREARQQLESRLLTAAADLDRARAEAGSFRVAAERARSERAGDAAQVESMRASLQDATAELDRLRAAADAVESPAPMAASPAPAAPAIDVGAIGKALRDASVGLDQVSRALAEAAAALDPGSAADEVVEDLRTDADTAVDAPASSSGTLPASTHTPALAPGADALPPVRSRDAAPRRVPAALPPAVFHDSAEAAEHLVRLNGAVVLVDGYNVTHLRWPELSIAVQRRRLIDALGGLAARTGADVHVVFDGVEQVDPPLPPERRRLVRVSFSPSDTEADDVIVGMVSGIPLRRPVIVASNDRRVQTEAAHAGANVISSDQLLALIGR